MASFVIKMNNGDTGSRFSPGEGTKTIVSLTLFQNIFYSASAYLLFLPPALSSLFTNFLRLWFPWTYVGTIDVQLTLARHGRASV